MFGHLFNKKKTAEQKAGPVLEPSTSTTTPKASTRPLNVLVMDGDPSHNWPKLFENRRTRNDRAIVVYQCSWNKCEVTVYPDSGPIVHIGPLHESTGLINIAQGGTANFRPHFVLVRNQPRGAIPVTDCRHVLFGLMMANIPAMNSWQAIYFNLERPLMLGALRSVRARLGFEAFPLIDATFYSNERQMVIAPEMPAVIKVSHAHAGMGKIKVDNHTAFRDVSTIVALNDDYCTAERFIQPEYGIRVQKVGSSYCVMKKNFTGSGWKSQFGGSQLTEIELTPQYKLWADECSQLFGGMDLLAVDAIHSLKEDRDYIIELNGTAIGILPERWEKDSLTIVDLVVQKLNDIYCKTTEEDAEAVDSLVVADLANTNITTNSDNTNTNTNNNSNGES